MSLPAEPFDHKDFVLNLSSRPGVYRMVDLDERVIYVGKARNLKKRVGSYFRASGLTTKTMAMVAKIARIEISITHSETEALLLEQSLIKELKPPYNIQLRDDKSYPYILLTDHADYPRLMFLNCPPEIEVSREKPAMVVECWFDAKHPCGRAATKRNPNYDPFMKQMSLMSTFIDLRAMMIKNRKQLTAMSILILSILPLITMSILNICI